MSSSATSTPSSRPVVFVTGAAGGGIGTCTAVRFAEAGYDVVATDIKPLEGVKKSVEDIGSRCLALPLDVTKSDSVKEGMPWSSHNFPTHWLFLIYSRAGVRKALEHFGKVSGKGLAKRNIMALISEFLLPLLLRLTAW